VLPTIEQKLVDLDSKYLSKDDLKKFDYQVAALTKETQQLQGQLRTKFDELKSVAKEVEMLNVEMMKYVDIKEINLLRNRIDGIDSTINIFRKSIGDFEKKVKQMKAKEKDQCDQAALDRVSNYLKQLKDEFDEFRDEINSKVVKFEEDLSIKANKSEIIDLDNRTMINMKDIMELLGEKCKKEDVNKKLTQMSRKLKELADVLGV
jgi:hypothetical protein